MKTMKKAHLYWIVPLCAALAVGLTAVVFVVARAWLDANVQFYWRDAFVRTEKMITWHEVERMLRGQGLLSVVVFAVVVAVFNRLIIELGNWARRKISERREKRAEIDRADLVEQVAQYMTRVMYPDHDPAYYRGRAEDIVAIVEGKKS